MITQKPRINKVFEHNHKNRNVEGAANMILNQEEGGRKRILREDGAIYIVLSITRSGLAVDSRPRIQIVGEWLPELGFVKSALVQTLPEPDGLVLNLCDRNINYSELFNETKEKGGALNRLYISAERTSKGHTLVTTGQHIISGGLKVGDSCIAKCEYGRIRVRKVSGNVRLINVAQSKDDYTKKPKPMVYLFGEWLNDIGFATDTLVTAKPETGCITFTAYDKAIIYSDIVRLARKNKMKLIQVSTQYSTVAETPEIPLISVTGSCVERAGLMIGDILSADYEYGAIKIRKLDPQRFGFPEEGGSNELSPFISTADWSGGEQLSQNTAIR